MHSPNDHHRTAWIPWVFALVALFGVNALVPDHSRSRRHETSDEIGISQVADNSQSPGRTFQPLVLLSPDSAHLLGFLNPTSSYLRIGAIGEIPVAQTLDGTAQGRAPPAGFIS
jgi:hypothetical protein